MDFCDPNDEEPPWKKQRLLLRPIPFAAVNAEAKPRPKRGWRQAMAAPAQDGEGDGSVESDQGDSGSEPDRDRRSLADQIAVVQARRREAEVDHQCVVAEIKRLEREIELEE